MGVLWKIGVASEIANYISVIGDFTRHWGVLWKIGVVSEIAIYIRMIKDFTRHWEGPVENRSRE